MLFQKNLKKFYFSFFHSQLRLFYYSLPYIIICNPDCFRLLELFDKTLDFFTEQSIMKNMKIEKKILRHSTKKG